MSVGLTAAAIKATPVLAPGAILGLALGLAACGQGDSRAVPAAAPAAPDPGYLAAPQIIDLAHGADGSVTLSGRAMPSSQVRLASPGGARMETIADGKGEWRAPLGPVSEPVLYGLSAEKDGRRVQAEGYVAITPGGPTVALLRAGSGALVLDDAKAGLRLLAVDVDSAGATVVSGRALANAPLRVVVDGAAVIEAAASPDGRFGVTLPKALPPGPHHIEVVTARDSAAATITVGAIPPPTEGPYRMTPQNGGWRVDWITPGMGLQSTLLLSPPETGH
jgi:hypothetical protein